MNKQILIIAIWIGLTLCTEQRVSAAKDLQPSSEIEQKDPSATANKDKGKDDQDDKAIKERGANKPSPTPKDKGEEEGDEKSGKKNAAEPGASATNKDQAGRNENGAKEDRVNQPGPGPNDQGKNEGEKTQSTEKNVKEPNEMGRIKLDERKTRNANLDVEVAGPAKIKTTLQLYGKIAMNEDAVANVSPRFPGVVKTVSVRLGDTVQKGGVLAVVESNDSLRNYQVISEIAGTIIKKEVTVGEVVRDDKPIFTVADLSTVWIDFSVFPQDFRRLKLGQTVHISFTGNITPITGKIFYIAPLGSENTQSLLARAVVQNPEGLLRPGLFVIGYLEVDEVQVAVAIRPAAIQSLNEKTVVFVAEGNAFEAREVQLGIRDDSNVQVVSGISAGDRYVAANSFLLKAELGKGQVGDQD